MGASKGRRPLKFNRSRDAWVAIRRLELDRLGWGSAHAESWSWYDGGQRHECYVISFNRDDNGGPYLTREMLTDEQYAALLEPLSLEEYYTRLEPRF